MSYELPPRARGGAEEQLAALRDYLVRLAQELDQVERSGVAATGRTVLAAQEKSADALRAQASALKALIIKNASEITAQAEQRFDSLSSTYVAISDYGNYYEQIETQVRQSARETVESYHYTESIEALERFRTELNGQIRRGVLEDPETHELHLGIAISEELEFSGTEEIDGVRYDRLSPGQTLGLYTSAGWQFWINGVKRGWFSSADSMLHVSNLVVEDRLQLGGEWQITTSGGFGLRYTGG